MVATRSNPASPSPVRAGLSETNASIVVPGRICSSWSSHLVERQSVPPRGTWSDEAIEVLAEKGDHPVDLCTGDDQRRREDEAIADRASGEAGLEAEIAHGRRQAGDRGDRGSDCLVAGEFDRSHQADAADFPHERMVEQLAQFGLEIRAHIVGNALNDSLALEDFDVLQRNGGGDGMSGIGVAVVQAAGLVHQHTADPFAEYRGRDRGIARGQPLGDGDDVGLNVIGL